MHFKENRVFICLRYRIYKDKGICIIDMKKIEHERMNKCQDTCFECLCQWYLITDLNYSIICNRYRQFMN